MKIEEGRLCAETSFSSGPPRQVFSRLIMNQILNVSNRARHYDGLGEAYEDHITIFGVDAGIIQHKYLWSYYSKLKLSPDQQTLL